MPLTTRRCVRFLHGPGPKAKAAAAKARAWELINRSSKAQDVRGIPDIMLDTVAMFMLSYCEYYA